MAGTQGIADLVGALTGGAGIENAAYDRQAARMLEAREKQAMLDKRMQEAALVADQMRSRGNFERNSMDMPPEVRFAIMAGMGSDFNQGTQGMLNQQEFTNRNRLEGARLDEGFTLGNAVANALQPTPNIVGTVERVGDLLVSGNQGANPQVEQIMTALNAAAGAASDKSGTKGVREQKIQDAMQLYKMDRGTAAAFVDGYIKQDINEYTGNVVRQNILPEGSISLPGYGPATEIPITGGMSDVPPPAPPPGESLYDIAPVATGIGPTTQDLLAKTVTLFGGSADMEPTAAIQTMNTSIQDMVRALSINPRFPVAEQERIIREINLKPGLLTSPETLRSRMASIAKSLELRAAQAERDANDPSLSRSIRQAQSDNAVMIRNFLPKLGASSSKQTVITPELRNRAENALYDVPGFIEMPPERQDRLIELWIRDNGN